MTSRAMSALSRLKPSRTPDQPPEADKTEGCLVCSAPRVRRRSVTSKADATKVRDVTVCQDCGFVGIAELPVVRYRDKTSMDQLPGGGLRIGTTDRPGREFQMGRMAVDILGRDGLDLLVYGAGRSLDNHHLAALDAVHEVAIGDIMKVRDDAPFHDANQPATRTFDVVIASEVIEHFRTPRPDFARLFEFVGPEGLLVCGTSIKDSNALAGQPYIFYPDHTSYYSPRSLQIISRDHGFHIDFRTPQDGGVRKRYVMFSRSRDVMEQIALYFGVHRLAPSELT